MGILEIFTILFVALKLMGHIDWSWFWVFSPMIIGYSIALVIYGIVFTFFYKNSTHKGIR